MRAVWTIWTSLKSTLSKGRSKSTRLQCRLVINPETLETQREGEEGELVLSTINREAMPLLRCRIGRTNYFV